MSRPSADASVFQAIADPTRRAILDLLREGEQTVTELYGRALATVRAPRARGRRRSPAMSQSAFSQHLAVLRRARLVSDRRRGRQRCYSFNVEPLAEVAAWIALYDRFWSVKLEGLGRFLKESERAQRASSRRT